MRATYPTFADHCDKFSHDAINRYPLGKKITPRLIWENAQAQVVMSSQGYLVFDDTVLDEDKSFAIALVRRQ